MNLLRRIAESFWIRALVSAGLLVAVASQIDFRTAARLLADGEWGWFVLATVTLFGAFVVGSKRWHLYLLAAGLRVPFGSALRAFLIGVFTTNFLPSQVGGDVARIWIVGGPGTRTRAATTVVIDRLNGIVCLIVVAWIALAANPGPVPGALVATLGVVTGVAGAAALLGYLVFREGSTVARVLPGRVHGLAREAKDATRACLTGSVLWPTFLYGLTYQGMVSLSVWLIALSVSLGVPFSTLVVTLPITFLLGILPVSIGGLGVREASFVVLLGQAGVSATEAAVFSLLNGLAFALASLPAAFLLLRKGRQATEVAAPS